MKTRLFLISALIVLAFCSCRKEGVKLFQGRYGYTLSGDILCEYADTVDTEQGKEIIIRQRKFSIADEQGIMHVEPNGDKMVMTLKDYTGGVSVFDANAAGNKITIQPRDCRISILTESDNSEQSGLIPRFRAINVKVEGDGYRTNNLMVISMKYTGEDFELNSGSALIRYKIVSSNANCVATAE